MRPPRPALILVYGTSQKKSAARTTDIPIIDVTQPSWTHAAASAASPASVEDIPIACLGNAYLIAKRQMPTARITHIDNLESLAEEPENETGPAAAKIDDIVISRKMHPSVRNCRAWLSTHHIELIEKILGKGYKIEILDERNECIREIGDEE